MRPHSLVVGGTRGVGREVAKIFAAQGDIVSVLGRRPQQSEIASFPEISFHAADISDENAAAAAISRILQKGKIRNLVFSHRFRADGDAWTGEILTSLTATRTLIEMLVPEFDGSGLESIVFVSSVVSHFVAEDQPVGYHVAKAGICQMARYYAVTLGRRGIRVNTVSPSIFIKDESRQYYEEHEELRNLFCSITPLGRMGTAKEIANVVAFLCSPKASFITGQDIIVDGGISLQAQPSLARRLVH